MAFTNIWDESSPADTQLAKLGAQDMRSIQLNVRERMSAFSSGLAANRPTPEAVFVGVLYLATDTNKLYQWSGVVWNDITSVIQAMNPAGGAFDGASVVPTAGQTANSGADTFVTWGGASYDYGGLIVTPDTKFTIGTAGVYLINAYIEVTFNTVTDIWTLTANCRRIPGGAFSPRTVVRGRSGASRIGANLTGFLKLGVGDTLDLFINQDSGGVVGIDQNFSNFSIQRVRIP